MLPSESAPTPTNIRKLRPQAKLPTPAVLRTLTPEDIRCVKRVLGEVAEYVPNPRLDDPQAEAVLLPPSLDGATGPAPRSASDDSGVYQLDDEELLPSKPEREHHLFLRLNYCRRRLFLLLQAYQGKRLSAEAVRELLKWKRATQATQNELVRVNVPLVLAMAKRTRIPGIDLSDMISEGNLALLRSVDKFDCSRGYKFSTYACRSILKSFSRVASRTARYRGRFPAEFDPSLEKSNLVEQRRVALEGDCVDELRSILGGNSAHLTEVEREVILARFALDETGRDATCRARTLEQVGQMIGVTKERVRQIQNKALDKLRIALEDGVLSQ